MRKRVPFPLTVQVRFSPDAEPTLHVTSVEEARSAELRDAIEFTISPHMTLEEAALQIIALDSKAIPQFLEPVLIQMLAEGVDKYVKQRARASLQGLPSMSQLSESAVSPLMSDAQLELTSFINLYAKLVHSQAFDQLLDMEIEMAQQIRQLLDERDNSLRAIRERFKSQSLTVLAEDKRKAIRHHHQEEIDLMSVTFASQLEDLYLQQRLKFRKQVMNVNINAPNIEPSPPPLPARKQSSVAEVDDVVVVHAPSESLTAIIDTARHPNISSLLEMGFTEEQANCACMLTNDNLEQAIVLLLEDIDRINRTVEENRSIFAQSKAIASPPSSLNNNVVMMKQETSASWSPRSFFEQQLPTAKYQLNSWLDKARSQLDDLLLEDTSRNSSPLSPADNLTNLFTVSFGNHTKQIHNIILESSDPASLFQWPRDPVTARGIRAQTCATLYSKQLNGVVILVNPENLETYKFGKSSNQFMFAACAESTELHFDTVEYQIRKAEEQAYSKDAGNFLFEDGDFIITKHSNLPSIHVVFHLIAGNDSLQGEINQRSPVMVGLRNLLRIAGKYGVVNLTVPLVFLDAQPRPESVKGKLPKSLSRSTSLQALAQFASGAGINSNNANTQKQTLAVPGAALVKRSETVLKTLKSHLLESSMGANRANNTGSDSITGSTKFIVPKDIAKNEEQFWSKVNESIRVLFRTV